MNWLTTITGAVKGAITKGGDGSAIKAVTGLLDGFNLSKQEKEQFSLEYAKLEAEQNKQKEENIIKEIEAAYKNTADARAMQVAALNQTDLFAKRYVYFLSSFIMISAVTFGILMFFIHVPSENKRMVEMFGDVFLFAAAMTIINFFFGSSSGSTKKDDTINRMQGLR